MKKITRRKHLKLEKNSNLKRKRLFRVSHLTEIFTEVFSMNKFNEVCLKFSSGNLYVTQIYAVRTYTMLFTKFENFILFLVYDKSYCSEIETNPKMN